MRGNFRLAMVVLFLPVVGITGAAIAAPTTGVSALKPTETRTAKLAPTTAAPTPGSAPIQSGLRRPAGVYAHLDLTKFFGERKKTDGSKKSGDAGSQLTSLYQEILANPAISGFAIGAHWDLFNPNPPTSANAYDWSYLDDAFSQVAAWNIKHPAQAPKTIQLIVTAGFNSPKWLLDQLPSCDGLFQSPAQSVTNNCGKVTFKGFVEPADGDVLPLPWNPVYKSAFKTFLTALAARYGANPTFVSISVAGPTAASDEMFLPDNAKGDNPQTQFGTPIAPNDMWLKLLALQYPNQPAYQNSDQAFIDEWDNAIDMYGHIFSGLTLVVLPAGSSATGSDFPDFSQSFPPPPSNDSLYTAGDCSESDMSCAAVTMILTHLIDPSVGGTNGKATQTGGLKAYNGKGNLGVPGVKLLSAMTASLQPSARILGGAQYDKPYSTDATFVGCLEKKCTDSISPEQAEYNVLKAFFDGTPAASAFGGTPGTAPLNFLQDAYEDILYANAHVNAPVQVVLADGSSKSMTAQDLMNLASQNLLKIAETGR